MKKCITFIALLVIVLTLTSCSSEYKGPFFSISHLDEDLGDLNVEISEDKQIYKCFSCGAGGNVFTFVEEFEKISFIEAVKVVADFIGYDLSGYDVSLPQKNINPEVERLLNLVKEASEFYTYNLLGFSQVICATKYLVEMLLLL